MTTCEIIFFNNINLGKKLVNSSKNWNLFFHPDKTNSFIKIGFVSSLIVGLSACGGGSETTGSLEAEATNSAQPLAFKAAQISTTGNDQNVVTNTLVTLDGTSSAYASNGILNYLWVLMSKPAGSGSVLSSTTAAKPTFTPDIAGPYVVSLIVNDGKTSSAPKVVTISATLAKAGSDQKVLIDKLVTLGKATNSDNGQDLVTYAWSLKSKPKGSAAALSSANSARPTFTPDVPGTYVASLIANDGSGVRLFESVNIQAVKMLFEWDFEGVNPLNNFIQEKEKELGIVIAQDPVDPNNRVVKATVFKGGNRSELFFARPQHGFYAYADTEIGFLDKAKTKPDIKSLGGEIWMSFRIFKPQEQMTNGVKPSLVQVGPVENPRLSQNGGGTAFWQLRIRNGTTPTGDSWNSRIFGNNIFTPLPDNETNFTQKTYGKWEKFVIHTKYATDSSGSLEVWKDGVKYINSKGANAYDGNRLRIKFGVYGGSKTRDLTSYFDDIKICGADCSYDLVDQ